MGCVDVAPRAQDRMGLHLFASRIDSTISCIFDPIFGACAVVFVEFKSCAQWSVGTLDDLSYVSALSDVICVSVPTLCIVSTGAVDQNFSITIYGKYSLLKLHT